MNGVAERTWRAMGSTAHVLVIGRPAAATAALDRAVALVERLEDRWSRFRATSDISRANRADGRPVHVDPTTVAAVDEALAARARTGGRFDPTVERSLVALGYDRSHDLGPGPTAAASAAARTRTRPRPAGARVDVDHGAGTVAVERGAGLDLGGIGKGLAADAVVAELLATPGVLGACANLGGDLRAEGLAPAPRPDAWGIGVEGTDVTLELADGGGVATSTVAKRRLPHGAHHVVDPATGAAARTPVRTATAVAPTAAEAEVAATLALLDGWSDEAVLVIGHDGEVRTR